MMQERPEEIRCAGTVLVADDDEDSRIISRTVLAHAGYRVLEARTGGEVLRLAGAQHPDVIVMDLGLPVLDGWETTRRLKADSATAEIPVIVLTVHNQTDDLERARRVGCDRYLVKPEEPAALVGEVARILRGRD